MRLPRAKHAMAGSLSHKGRKHPIHSQDVSVEKEAVSVEDDGHVARDIGSVAAGKSGAFGDEGMFAQGCWDGWRHVRGEVSLWRAVITQALMDARSESKKKENQYHRQQARVWLEGRSDDFMRVCDHAQMSPELVRELASIAIHEHDAKVASQKRPVVTSIFQPAEEAKILEVL